VTAAQEAGFLLNATGPTRLRFAPPLVLSEAEVAELAAAWPAILDAASRGSS
jgi:acetylornithine aminotransferase